MTSPEHWRTISHRWSLVGSPLRPTREDQEMFARSLRLPGGVPRHPLILGVTPELSALPWPIGSEVRAVDCSRDMIQAIWPGDMSAVVQADWRTLPFSPGTFDTVLCDGGLHLLGYPEGHRQLVDSVAGVLGPLGKWAIRLFSLAADGELPETVWQLMEAGRLGSFHEFKLRLLMSLQESPALGVQVDRAYDEICGRCRGDWDQLARQTGWPLSEIQTLESYRGSPNRYHFLTEQQSLAALTGEGQFRLVERLSGTYPMAERCPVLLLEKV
ncbi:MAG TPA: hypothetical protein DDY91_10605 [Planctomycetaceae bacterium]|nr:hypothetical protein [Planctomycetaceae bacterium]